MTQDLKGKGWSGSSPQPEKERTHTGIVVVTLSGVVKALPDPVFALVGPPPPPTKVEVIPLV